MAPMERSIVTMTGTRPSRFQELRVGEGPVSVLEIPERIWGQVGVTKSMTPTVMFSEKKGG